nr:hypothetical protein [Tanacetum cinerariifolium]
MYRDFEEQRRGYQQMKEKNADMYEKMTRFMEDMRRVPEANTTPIITDQHFGVYMPINAGGVHWVTGAINLTDSIVYVFDSMESESRMTENANWTLAKSGTVFLHPENNRFMILTDPHIIGTLDGSVRPFPSWNDVTWVYMPINAGGVH